MNQHRPIVPPAPKPAALDRAAPALDEPENTTGIFRHLHTPRVLGGQSFTLRQVALGLLLVFCLSPWASPPIALALGLGLAQTVGNPLPLP